jgi:uncharacterized protein GlcG (DUF336 family)
MIPAAAKALDKVPEHSLEVAKKMAAACEAQSKEQNWKMNISAVDNGTNEIFFEKIGRCLPRQPPHRPSEGADVGAIPLPDASYRNSPTVEDLKGGQLRGVAQVPGIIAFAGGLPIMTADKVHVGGIGVSGGTADQDKECAQAGLDAVKDALE